MFSFEFTRTVTPVTHRINFNLCSRIANVYKSYHLSDHLLQLSIKIEVFQILDFVYDTYR